MNPSFVEQHFDRVLDVQIVLMDLPSAGIIGRVELRTGMDEANPPVAIQQEADAGRGSPPPRQITIFQYRPIGVECDGAGRAG